jgi:hypothetical protein
MVEDEDTIGGAIDAVLINWKQLISIFTSTITTATTPHNSLYIRR